MLRVKALGEIYGALSGDGLMQMAFSKVASAKACEIGICGMLDSDEHFHTQLTRRRGPLIFCLLLSLFLSIRASKEQTDLVFSGVFSIVWIGEAVVTLQIKLLGGNM